MHLTGGSSGLTLSPGGEGLSLTSLTSLSSTQTQMLASRKRKAWEGLNPGTSKWTGGQRPPALRYETLTLFDSESELYHDLSMLPMSYSIPTFITILRGRN